MNDVEKEIYKLKRKTLGLFCGEFSVLCMMFSYMVDKFWLFILGVGLWVVGCIYFVLPGKAKDKDDSPDLLEEMDKADAEALQALDEEEPSVEQEEQDDDEDVEVSESDGNKRLLA